MTLGVIAQEIVKEWRMRRVPRRFAGTWSHNVHVRDVMRTTGIIEHLNIKHEAPTPEVKTRFEMFNLVRGFVPSVRSFRSYALSWTAHCKSHRVKLTPKSIKSMMQPRKRFLKSVQAKQKRCKLAVGYLMRGETNYSNGSCACIASPLGVKSRMSILSQKSTSPARRKSRATTEDTEARLLLKLNRMIARAAPRAALKRVAALNRFYSDIAAEIRRVG